MQRLVALLLTLSMFVVACSDDTSNSSTNACIQGTTQVCACTDGSMGAQTCNAQGGFDACVCESSNNTNVGNMDAGVPDMSDSDGGAIDMGPTNLNECGGSSDLTNTPGSACGPCMDGFYACDGAEAVECIFASELNACGECGELRGTPGDSCGCGDGVWQCTDGDVACTSSPQNVCGGCQMLTGDLREACDGGNGYLSCTSEDNLVCVPVGGNACGGTAQLAGPPGAACGECQRGKWECDGNDSVVCNDAAVQRNACGGCGVLDDTPGDSCGPCGGTVVCNGAEATRCDASPNACGGCGALGALPGSNCPGGLNVCDGSGGLTCSTTATNACGGNTSLAETPGSACGTCGGGVVICAGQNTTVCVGDSRENACGGCAPLPLEVGASCGPDQIVTCDGADAVVCEDTANLNECGGTTALTDTVGETCGDPTLCGRWECDGVNALRCGGQDNDPNDILNCESCGTQCSMTEQCVNATCVPIPTGPGRFVDIELGRAHGCALDVNGKVWCWGDNSSNQVGVPGSVVYPEPTEVPNLGTVVDIAADSDFSCAANSNGQVFCWGSAQAATFGGTGSTLAQPAQISGVNPNIDQIDAGWGTICARNTNKQLQCWGANSAVIGEGKAGNGTGGSSVSPGANVLGLTNVNDFSVGQYHVCAINGTTAFCWGRDGRYQLGDNSVQNTTSPVQVTLNGQSFTEISAGSEHTCGISNLKLYCWGEDDYNQAGGSGVPGFVTEVTNPNLPLLVEAGLESTFVVRSSGEIWPFGRNVSGSLGTARDDGSFAPALTILNNSQIIDVSASDSWACALDNQGTIYCWGTTPNNVQALLDGQLNPIATRYSPVASPYTNNGAELCNDGLDNDGDGDIDCSDSDCFESTLTGTGTLVSFGTGPAFDTNDGNYYSILNTCSTSSGGRDKLFVWKAPTAGNYRISGSTFGSVGEFRYYLLDGCNSNTNLQQACYTYDLTMGPAMGLDEFSAAAGQDFIIVVEIDEFADILDTSMMGGLSEYSITIDTVP